MTNHMKILMLDIETAPHKVYSWGLWDQNIAINQIEEAGYTICWAARWHGTKDVIFNSIRKGEKKMIKSIWNLLDESDAVVHYNGLRFDTPTLNLEFLKNKMHPPSPYKQVDLLTTARKQFRMPSNKMDYVAKVLGHPGKIQHKGMDLWKDCMAGDEKAWKIMERYNKRDVTELGKIYVDFLPWIKNHPNQALYGGDIDVPKCSNCGSLHVTRQGQRKVATTTRVYQRWQCQDCGTWLRSRLSEKGVAPVLVQVGG